MDKLSGDDLRSFVIVLAALVVFLGGVLSIAKNWRDLRKPNEDMATWRKNTDSKLKRDDQRLISLEDGNRALCQGMLAILNHEITGNSVDKLRKAQETMQDYLINR